MVGNVLRLMAKTKKTYPPFMATIGTSSYFSRSETTSGDSRNDVFV